MIIIYLIIIFLIFLLIEFPKFFLLLISLLLIYPFLKNKFNSSSDFIIYIKNLLNIWWNEGELKKLKLNELEIPKNIPKNANFNEIQNIIDNKWDTISYEEKISDINEMFNKFPIIKQYQDWLYSQQDLYIEYQLDVKNIWEEMLVKLVLITKDTYNYCNQNFQDFLEYQQKLLDIMEFIKSQSNILNEEYGINYFVKEMILKNREFNNKISIWIKNNLEKMPIKNRLGCQLENFNIEDWVAPYNFYDSNSLSK